MNSKINFIRMAVEDYSGIDLMQHTRCRQVADNKKIFVYLVRKYTTLTYREIAIYLRYNNHTTMIAAHRSCEDLKRYKTFANTIAGIEKKINDDAEFAKCVGELRHR